MNLNLSLKGYCSQMDRPSVTFLDNKIIKWPRIDTFWYLSPKLWNKSGILSIKPKSIKNKNTTTKKISRQNNNMHPDSCWILKNIHLQTSLIKNVFKVFKQVICQLYRCHKIKISAHTRKKIAMPKNISPQTNKIAYFCVVNMFFVVRCMRYSPKHVGFVLAPNT